MSVKETVSIEVPAALRDTITKFCWRYTLESANDVVEFGIGFFTKMQWQRFDKLMPGVSRDTIDGRSCTEIGQTTAKEVGRAARGCDPEDEEEPGPSTLRTYKKTDEERGRLLESIKSVVIFRSLKPAQMNRVLDCMFEKPVKYAETIIKQGDQGDNFYVIESGIFRVIMGGEYVHVYRDQGVFGESALLYNMPRTVTVRAEADGMLWAMDCRMFRCILTKAAFEQRKTYQSLLYNVPLLKDMQPIGRIRLTDAMITKTYKAGECIAKQGNQIDGLYIVEEGIVSVKMVHDDAEVEIGKLKKGDYFGEVGLITNGAWPTSVYAIDDVKMVYLNILIFQLILGALIDALRQNLKETDDNLQIMVQKFNVKESKRVSFEN